MRSKSERKWPGAAAGVARLTILSLLKKTLYLSLQKIQGFVILKQVNW